MLINPEGISYGKEDGLYAVPIDDIDVNAIFYSRSGKAIPLKNKHVFTGYSRECWDVVGGDQAVFVDWKRFIEIQQMLRFSSEPTRKVL